MYPKMNDQTIPTPAFHRLWQELLVLVLDGLTSSAALVWQCRSVRKFIAQFTCKALVLAMYRADNCAQG